MTELEALRERHSVRNYKDTKIDKDTLDRLSEFIEKCNAEGNLNIKLCPDAKKTYNKLMNKAMGLGSAPSVIACIGKDDATLDERVGYYGQKIVLFAQSLGLNTCWTGTYNAKNVPAVVGAGERLAIVIALGYGINPGRERKSKSIDQVTSAENMPDWFKAGVEAALLAPTAINQQKFEIKLNDDNTVDFIDKGGILSKIDIGIVKYNFEVGSKSVEK